MSQTLSLTLQSFSNYALAGSGLVLRVQTTKNQDRSVENSKCKTAGSNQWGLASGSITRRINFGTRYSSVLFRLLKFGVLCEQRRSIHYSCNYLAYFSTGLHFYPRPREIWVGILGCGLNFNCFDNVVLNS